VITVATFNTRHGRPPRGFADNRLLVEAAVGLGDVVGLQEVERHVVRSWFRHQPRRIARAGHMAFVYAPVRRLALTGDDGIALLVRGEILSSSWSLLPHNGRKERRAAIVARVRVRGQELTVATTHLQNRASVAAHQLDAVVAALAAAPGPQVLLGDLNLGAERVAPRLPDGFALAGGDPTFPADRPTRRIDHVAVRALNLESVAVRRAPVSDHRAVVATITS
jgi:endonuclease/exonuclease/phosphatase family metal-dependent hydrolase